VGCAAEEGALPDADFGARVDGYQGVWVVGVWGEVVGVLVCGLEGAQGCPGLS
jgi:hypothetical protein